MSSDIAIQVRGVSKSFPIYSRPHHRLMQMVSPSSAKSRWFREFRALSGVCFDIGKGETVGIMGRNGSGKSTLLQIICGTLAPSEGDVQIHGRVAALLELGAGFNPEFTGRENVFLNGTLLGLTRDEIERKFGDILAFADIGQFIDQPVKSYSSGMYVRLAFAVAINVDPDILIVDEALSVGDEAFQRKCFARIEKIRSAGATILFVSHSAGAVLELCNKAVMLDGGELLALGAPKTVVSRYQKLLYAPASMAESIRSRYREELAAVVAERRLLPESVDTPQEHIVGMESQADIQDAYFDPSLRSQSAVRFVAQGAVIEDVRIETVGGERVNVLRAGGEYVFCYTAGFQRTVTNVRFGMLIKSISGIELGGAVTAGSHEIIDVVEAGQRFGVKTNFRCLVSPGTYFMNAGIRGRLDEEETFLDRLIDVEVFRVLPDPGRLATGFVDFHVRPQFEILD